MHTILIIDDDQTLTRVIEHGLAIYGYHSIVANNGQQGLELAQKFQPDLILLDLMMPDFSGFEVCHVIRKQSDIPIIILSACEEEQEIVRALGAGADAFVSKPVQIGELTARVTALLRRRGWERNNVARQLREMREALVRHLMFELQAPLTLVRETLDVIVAQADAQNMGAQISLLTQLRHNVQSFKQVLEDIFIINHPVEEVAAEPFDVETFLDDVRQELWPLLNHKEQELRLLPLLIPLSIEADRAHVWLMVRHLLANAVQFSPRGSVILLHSESLSPQMTEISVIDSGVGIAVEEQTAVFDKFYKVDDYSPGLGLGLTVVQKIAAANQGSIHLESDGRKGCCVRLRLPVAVSTEVSL